MTSRSRARRFASLAAVLAAALLAIHLLAGRARRAAHSAVPVPDLALIPQRDTMAPPEACVGPPPPVQNAEFEQRVIELVNQERRAAGLAPLKSAEPLVGSGRWFARDMATYDYFAQDHDSYYRSRGELVHACDWRTRVGRFYASWTTLAENIGAGYDSPARVVEAWMSSPGHRAKILGEGVWETGVGYWPGGSEGSYWVQDFGRRDGVFPVVIDGELAHTRTPQVTLHVYGSWREMRLRNDQRGFGTWRGFASDLDWVLEDAPGTRTVTVELRDGSQTAIASDTIELDR
jgi:uncharacterized protein YkwD